MRFLLLVPLLLILAPTHASECRCACMAGQAVTLCAGVEAARDGGDLCPIGLRCPAASSVGTGGASDRSSTELAPPVPDAVNCRHEAVWDVVTKRYEPRKICNLRDAGGP